MIAVLSASLVALVVFLSTVAAGAHLTARALGARAVGSVAGGLLISGVLAYGLFWVAFVSAGAAAVLGAILALGALVVAVVGYAPHWRRIVPGAALVVGIAAATLGVLMLSGAQVGLFERAATRLVPWFLPPDNQIPALLATWVSGPRGPAPLIGDWLAGDRPPLQSGYILLARGVMVPFQAVLPADTVDFAGSFAAQLLWIPAVAALLWAAGFAGRVVRVAIAFVAVVPVIYLHELFTWPKLLAAAFSVAAVAVLLAALRDTERPGTAIVLAAPLTSLSVLAHGGSAFVVPLILVMTAILLLRRRRSRLVTTVGAAAATVLALYIPWLAFQRFVSPPGDRLLKWHLAGVVAIDDRGFLTALVDQYQSLTWDEIVRRRLSNLSHAFDPAVWQGLDVWHPGWVERRLSIEFYDSLVALSVGILPVLALLVWAVVRGLRRRPVGARSRRALWLGAGAAASMVLWCLLLFLPDSAVVHQGSHAWMLILLAVPSAWLTSRAPVAGAGVVALQLTLSAVTVAAVLEAGGEGLRVGAIAAVVVGLVAVAVGIRLPGDPSTRSARRPSRTALLHSTP